MCSCLLIRLLFHEGAEEVREAETCRAGLSHPVLEEKTLMASVHKETYDGDQPLHLQGENCILIPPLLAEGKG